MRNTNTGGQAFPCLERGGNGLDLTDGGMTLRDYFAAKATDDDVAYYKFTGGYHETVRTAPDGTKHIVQEANTRTREQAKYAYADAMLKAREN